MVCHGLYLYLIVFFFFFWHIKLKIQHGGHSYSPSFSILSCPKFLLHFQLSFHLIGWWFLQTDDVNLCTLDFDEDIFLSLYQNLVLRIKL